MTTETGATGGEAISSVALPADAPETFDSPTSAANYLADLWEKRDNPAESADAATAATELSDEGNAAADSDQPTGETEETDQPEKAPLELPRSWTKDRAEVWNRLDPAAQEILLDQDRKASAEVRRVQNEAADERKAASVERSQAEQARKQYEAKLPALMQELQSVNQASFADIKTMDDVVKLQNDDPFRFQAWQVHQMRLQTTQVEIDKAEGRKAQDHQSEWTKHIQKENELAVELIPELADKTKGSALIKRASDRLADLGFKNDELNDLASGKQKLSVYDHRFQRLVADSLELAQIKSAKTAIAAKPLPNVQRPGAARAPGAANADNIKALETKLNSSGSEKDAFALYMARQGSRRAS